MSELDPIVLVRQDELRVSPGQTTGMLRREAFADEGAWVGLVTSEPRIASGWHHHADYDTYIHVLEGRLRMEAGPEGRDIHEAIPGDFLRVPPGAVHRESNPDATSARFVIVRIGSGVPVVNVDGPARADG